MTDGKHQEVKLTEIDESEMVQYKAVSRLALLTLALGLGSGLALAHAIFWAVPAAAVLTGALSLRAIAASRSSLIGRKAALSGLALALFFGTWTPAAAVSRR